MLIYYIIVLFFLVFAWRSYKNALMVWAGITICFHIGICLKYSSPAISVCLAINCVFLGLYICKYRQLGRHYNFVLKPILIFVGLSYLVSSIFSQSPFIRNIVTSSQIMINEFVSIYLISMVIRNEKDIRNILKVLSTVIILSIVYAIYIMITNTNPILDYELSLIPASLQDSKLILSTETFRGLKMQSFFGGASQFAGFVSITSLLFIAITKNIEKRTSFLLYCVIILAIAFSFISKTRAGIFAVFIAYLPFMYKEGKNTFKFVLVAIVFVLIMPDFISSSIPFITSIFDEKSQAEVGGSSGEMRFLQFQIVFEYLLTSPISGLGVNTGGLIVSNSFYNGLYGAESIWLWIMLDRGLLGVFSYCFIFYFTIRKISYKMRIYMLCIAVYWLVLNTLSTTGLNMYMYYLAFILIYKKDQFVANKLQK